MSQFGGSSREDDYGYFGSAKPGTSSSAFGASPEAAPKPSSQPLSQFGAPPLAGTQPFGTPAPAGFQYAPPTSAGVVTKKRSRTAKRVLLVVLTLGAIGVGYIFWNIYQVSRPVTLPPTLVGLPMTTDPTLTAATKAAEEGIRGENPGINLGAQSYGSRKSFALLFVTRGRVDVDKELQDLGVKTGPTTVGASTCALSTDALAFCMRASRTHSVEVLMSPGTTVEQAAAAVDEAWAAQ